MLTLAKLSVGYLVVGIYRRTQQGALAALLPYLYKLQVVHVTTICLPHVYFAVTVQDCTSCPNVHVSYIW